ncbi:hypothetical protein GCM10020254_67690 [Streptomyces goshikiensis]
MRGAEDHLGRDDLREGGQRPAVVGFGAALDDEAVDETAALPAAAVHLVGAGSEADPDADSGLCGLGELGGDGVVPELVEVEDALVDEDPGDGELFGERRAPPGARLGLGGPWPSRRRPSPA